jgi:hypothetical protein
MPRHMGATSGLHEDLSRKAGIKLSSDRTFGLAFGTFFALLGAFPALHHGPIRSWALLLSGLFLLTALALPSLLHPLNRLAAKFAEVMHTIVSPVMVGLFFFACLTPLALVYRMFRKDPLGLRFDLEAKTYWVKRESSPAPESMVNQF